jgi:hypothetical protein
MSMLRIATAPRLVLSSDMAAAGLDALVRTEIRHGSLERVRRGAYVDAESARLWSPEERFRTQVQAVLSTRASGVAAGLAAAVLLGFPMTGSWPSEVQVLATGASGRRRNGVIEVPRRGAEVTIESGGFCSTSVVDTLLEVCRSAPFLTALTMVDAAIRIDRYGRRPSAPTRDELWSGYDLRMPFRGSRRVRRVLEFAATGADTPFETLSRMVVDELGFPEPTLQHPIWLPRSRRTVFCDLAWPDYRIDGEADGWGKYVNPEYGPDIALTDRVRLEKRRENEVRGVRWTPARWEWRDAWHREPLRAILLEAGLPIVRRRRATV